MHEGSCCSTSLPAYGVDSVINFSHSSNYVVFSHCLRFFNLINLWGNCDCPENSAYLASRNFFGIYLVVTLIKNVHVPLAISTVVMHFYEISVCIHLRVYAHMSVYTFYSP